MYVASQRLRTLGWLAAAGLLALLGGCMHTPPETAPGLTLRHLRGSIYVVEDNFYAKENSLVYVGTHSVSVIGATWTPETARLLHEEIKKVTDVPVSDVLLTNHHPDRAGGSAYWLSIGAELRSTQLTAQLIEERWLAVTERTREAFPNYPPLAAITPTAVYDGNFATQDGHIQALYLGPSHTDDGIFVYFPAERVLYGGCILKEQLGNLADANVPEYPSTLRRLDVLELDIDLIVAGHWAPVHDRGLLRRYLKMLEDHAVGSGAALPPTTSLERTRER